MQSNNSIEIPYQYGNIKLNIREDSKTDRAIVKEIFEENVYRISDQMLSDNPVILDIGANIGIFTLEILTRLKNSNKTGTIIAVEPEPNNVALLQKNLEDNQHLVGNNNVVIVPCAVGDKFSMDVKISNEHGDSRIGDTGTRVSMMTLENLLTMYGIVKVDIAKFDIEGYEVPVIKSIPKNILLNIHHTAIEFDESSTQGDFITIIKKFIDIASFSTLGVPARGCYIYTENHLWQG